MLLPHVHLLPHSGCEQVGFAGQVRRAGLNLAVVDTSPPPAQIYVATSAGQAQVKPGRSVPSGLH